MLQYVALAALAGFFLPLQALINARISGVFNGPILAALVNFVSGTVAIIVLIALFRVPLPSAAQAAMVPSYGWLTGLFGAFFVAQAAFTVPKLGAAGMIALVVAGQMVGSIAFDHFGVLQPAQPVTLQKALGAVFLMAGVYLILRPGE
jgi:transporter family-2 protein